MGPNPSKDPSDHSKHERTSFIYRTSAQRALQHALAQNVTSPDEHATVQKDARQVQDASEVGHGTVGDEDVGRVEGNSGGEVGEGAAMSGSTFDFRVGSSFIWRSWRWVGVFSRLEEAGREAQEAYKVFKVEAGSLATFPASRATAVTYHVSGQWIAPNETKATGGADDDDLPKKAKFSNPFDWAPSARRIMSTVYAQSTRSVNQFERA